MNLAEGTPVEGRYPPVPVLPLYKPQRTPPQEPRPMPTEPPSKQFNLILESDQRIMLDALAQKAHEPAAQVVRRLIRSQYLMAFKQVLLCATGEGCRCPHMHPITTPNPPHADPPYPRID